MRRCLPLLALPLLLGSLLGQAPNQPLPPREAPQHMTLPPGFKATLFAGEPDVVQPIAFTFDDRGRLWVAECLSYPNWLKEGETGKDRLIILEDTNGDGQFDKRTVFHDKLANLSGLAVGHGGVWVCATPNLLFIPDRDGDDVPDSKPEIILDGWDLKAKHNVFNGLTWGPDGWLYGCNGILSNSRIGKPGTPEKDRVKMNCGVWRFHPVRKEIEWVASGTTNPWGLDFDDYGQMFITNCVIHHLWHVVPGAHFQRMFGQDLNPYCYGLLQSVADHIHWGGGPWQSSRGGQGVHDEPGGGHAHSGAMIYLGDNWPERYRNGAFMCNIHGNRINHDLLERQGSSYVARHGKDFLLANDPWFRGLTVAYGPDGGVYVSDWCDTGECHDYDEVHRTSGRIYKITHGKVTPFRENLARLSDAELVKRQLQRNDWHVRQARRLLQERAAAGKLTSETRTQLRAILNDNPDVTRKLRALWALHVTDGLDEKLLLALLESPHEAIRAWTIQLALEAKNLSPTLGASLAQRARKDPSPLVRLYLASALQRLTPAQGSPIAEGLLTHGEDASDPYLPLMIWYGVEPLVLAERDHGVKLLAEAKIPLVREYLARRITTIGEEKSSTTTPPGLEALITLLARVDDPVLHRDVLRGIHEALLGRRTVPQPRAWAPAYSTLASSPYPEVRERAVALAVQFGDPRALTTLRQLVQDGRASARLRQDALQTLLQKQSPDLLPLLQEQLGDGVLRRVVLRGLANYDDAKTPALILRHYGSFNQEERADALQTLASRPAYARALLDAMERGQIPRRDLSAYTARQLAGLNNKEVTTKLTRVWGTIRPASQEKSALLSKYRQLLTPDTIKKGNRSRGRKVYAQVCASCHKLFDEGGAIGPELTGSQRANLDYLLENLLDPSAVVAQDYQMSVFETKKGRVITGIVKQETERTLTIQTINESVILPKEEIDSRQQTRLSLMPEGLLEKLTKDEIRDLVAYLASPEQVSLPPSK